MRDINASVTGTLDASAQTVTFNTAIDKNKLLTIVNTTVNIEIYTANDETNGGTLDGTNTILTLDYDTTSMADSDLLQVIYEGQPSTAFATQSTLAAVLAKIIAAPATEAKQDAQITQETAAAASLAIMDDWDESDRAKVNPIVGQAGVQGGSGAVSNNTQRVVLATDIAIPAGTNTIGKTYIAYQTTKALTNAAVSASSSGENTLVSGTGSQTIRVFKLVLVASSAVSVTLKDAAGGTSLTGAIPLTANGAMVLESNDGEPLFVSASSGAFIMSLSAAVQVSGYIQYTKS